MTAQTEVTTNKKAEKIESVDGKIFYRNFLRQADWIGLSYVSIKFENLVDAANFYGKERILNLINGKAQTLCMRQALSKLPTLEGNDTEKAELKETAFNQLDGKDIIDIKYFDDYIPGDRPWTMASVTMALKAARKADDKVELRRLLVIMADILNCGEEVEEDEIDIEEEEVD